MFLPRTEFYAHVCALVLSFFTSRSQGLCPIWFASLKVAAASSPASFCCLIWLWSVQRLISAGRQREVSLSLHVEKLVVVVNGGV